VIAENIMITDLVTAQSSELVGDVFKKMRDSKLRMLPVLDNNKSVVGVVSTFGIMQSVIPEYITSGDLKQVSFVPDIGILSRHYQDISSHSISEVMQKSPLFISKDESILSVSSALSAYGKHEYALVVTPQKQLLGVISAGDILDIIKLKASEVNNA